ncbi:MAG TPA: serine hydrolase domain-containing protein [Chitinophagaceae bacterium]|jgi:CubicO group peptidase (beta-lactamase class C family)|nr:serine hydrolase domain-containing protein [Chitinophagaceae bacterium]
MSASTLRNCLNFSPVLLFLLLFQSGSAQKINRNAKEFGTDRHSGLDALVQSKIKELGEEVAVLVWTDTLVYKRETGTMNARTPAPIAVASQWLTAALVMSFVDEGKLDLDDKVSQYIPSFARYGKNYVTLRTCLTHMNGIQSSSASLAKALERKKYASLEEEVDAYAAREIQTNPGTEFRYNNMGPAIAARVLEIVSKKKFDMLIQQRLFRPVGMRQTTFSTTDGSGPNPSGGARTTGDDFIRFMAMLLNEGMANGKQVLSPEAVRELRKLQIPAEKIRYAPKAAEGYTYALGAWVEDSDPTGYARTLSAPGLYGAWPVIDFCKGYVLLVLPKELQGEQKRELYLQLKAAADEEVKSPKAGGCK